MASGMLRLYDRNGVTLLGLLPDFAKAELQEAYNDTGTLNLDYPRNGVNADLLLDQDDIAIVQVMLGGVVQPDWYLLEDDNDDPAAAAGDARLVTFTGRGVLALFERAIIYPSGYDGTPASLYNKPTTRPLGATMTVGGFVLVALTEAQARGAIPTVTVDFTATHDSAGTPWPTLSPRDFDVGQSMLDLLTKIAEDGDAAFRMRGLTLQMYVPDTGPVGADHPDQILYLGRDVTSGPRQRSRRTMRSAMLLVGDEGAIVERTNATTEAAYGRIEAYDGRGGITDVGLLNTVGTKELNGLAKPAEAITLAYLAGSGGPQPYADYLPGDYIRYDQRRIDATRLEPLRVRTIARTVDQNGLGGYSIELNDILTEWAIRLQRRIDALLNGSTSNNRAPAPVPYSSASIPSNPASLSASSDVYALTGGSFAALAVLTWALVTTNTDGSPFTDFGRYEYDYRVDGGAWHGVTGTDAPPVFISGLRPGGSLDMRVRVVDVDGNHSDWVQSNGWPLKVDQTPPPVAAAPVVDAWLGTVRVTWNGLGSAGEAMPADFAYTEVHLGTSPTFTVDPANRAATRVAVLSSSGSVVLTGLTYGTTYYARLVTVDRAGNAQAASAVSAGATPTAVLGKDLAANAVGPNAIAYKDLDNFVPDGSFETSYWTDPGGPLTGVAWASITGSGYVGGHSLRLNAAASPGTTRRLYLTGETPIRPGEELWRRFAYRGTGSNGVARYGIRWTSTTGVQTFTALASTTNDSAWHEVAANGANAPADVATFALYVEMGAEGTTGTIDVDIVEARRVIQTAIIDDAAIQNAQIDTLAVTTGKVNDLAVGKLTSGTLAATVIGLNNGGLLTTAAVDALGVPVRSGARVEIDGSGLRLYDTTSVDQFTGIAIDINKNGSATFKGSITAGSTITGATIIATRLPASVYNANHVRNAGVQDLDAAGLAIDWNYHTASGGQVSGSGSWAWQSTAWSVGIETGTAHRIAGTQSLRLRTTANDSGVGVSTSDVSVTPGEKWDIVADAGMWKAATGGEWRPMFVTALFLDATGALIATVPAPPLKSGVYTLGGGLITDYLASGLTRQVAGRLDVVNGVTPGANGTWRFAATFVVPTGAVTMRLAFALWASQPNGSPTNTTTTDMIVDSVQARRSFDAAYMQSGEIIGSIITGSIFRTAVAPAQRTAILPGNLYSGEYSDPIEWFSANVGSQTSPPRALAYDYVSTHGGNHNIGVWLRGGVASLGGVEPFGPPYNENEIIIYPRDQTDEQLTSGTGSILNGIQFNLGKANSTASGDESLKGLWFQHRGTDINNGIQILSFENNVGLRFASGSLWARDWVGTNWKEVKGTITNVSDPRAKTGATHDLGVDPLDLIRATTMHRFKYIGQDDDRHPDDDVAAFGWKIGPMADTLPRLIVDVDSEGGLGLNPNTLASIAWVGIREVAEVTDRLADRLAKVESLLGPRLKP